MILNYWHLGLKHRQALISNPWSAAQFQHCISMLFACTGNMYCTITTLLVYQLRHPRTSENHQHVWKEQENTINHMQQIANHRTHQAYIHTYMYMAMYTGSCGWSQNHFTIALYSFNTCIVCYFVYYRKTTSRWMGKALRHSVALIISPSYSD